MYQLNCRIEIGGFQFGYVAEIEIKSSWKQLTDTAMVSLPKSVRFGDKELKDLIRQNDPVRIWLGYDGNLKKEFEGYVTKVEPNIPLKIHCQDAMWLLKQNNVVASFRNPTLAEIVAAVVPPNIPFVTGEMQFGAFRINNVSAAKVLSELQRNYGIYSFFRDGVLYVGKGISSENNPSYHFQQNVVSRNLQYRLIEDAFISIKGISLFRDNSIIEYEVGDNGGEQYLYSYYGLSEGELKSRIDSQYELLQYEGYQGSIEVFGTPFVQHSDVTLVMDNEYPDRVGRYQVDGVTTRFGQSGFRRTIELGRKI